MLAGPKVGDLAAYAPLYNSISGNNNNNNGSSSSSSGGGVGGGSGAALGGIGRRSSEVVGGGVGGMGDVGLEHSEAASAAEMERSLISEMYREWQQRYDVDGQGKCFFF